MKKSSFSTLFLIRNRVTKNGKSSIRVRVTINGDRVEWNTGYECALSDWSAVSGKAVSKKQEVLSVKSALKAIEVRITSIYTSMVQFGKDLNAESLYNSYFGLDKKIIPSLLSLYEKRIENKKKLIGAKGGIKETTFFKYAATYNKMSDFLCRLYFDKHPNELKRKSKLSEEELRTKIDIPVTTVNYEFITDYEIFMKSKEGKCAHNATTRHLRFLKRIIEDARKSRIIEDNPFDEFLLYNEKVDPVFLEEFELIKLMEKKFTCSRLEEVRDIFVFCCYTGLSYGDVKNLRSEHIYANTDGLRWIKKNRIKTDNRFDTPLFDIAEMILKKYSGYEYEYENEGGYLLPVRCNQKSNEYLKEIASLCGINKELTTHTARHTFATLCLTKGVSIESLARIMGHSDIKTTQIYARITLDKINREMCLARPELDRHFGRYAQIS